MKILVVLEHDRQQLRPGSLSAIGFANDLARQTGGEVFCLLLGDAIDPLAQQAAQFAPVLAASSPLLADPLADRHAHVIADVAGNRQVDLVVAASSTYSRDVVSRAGGLLGGAMASDIVAHAWTDGRLVMKRPMYAGAILATVVLQSSPQVVTVRPSAYPPAEPLTAAGTITPLAVDETSLPSHARYDKLESKPSHRPDVTEASVVVSGGRAIRNADDFERLVGGLADCLGGATGSSRALVDAGITPNELQVGQTGKIVSPDLYLALGISGAVQHLAGMKNSKRIVAINSDPDAPIFEVADYGLVADIYDVVPDLTSKLARDET
jgi:electron transfer flavoprotein alpha subunit